MESQEESSRTGTQAWMCKRSLNLIPEPHSLPIAILVIALVAPNNFQKEKKSALERGEQEHEPPGKCLNLDITWIISGKPFSYPQRETGQYQGVHSLFVEHFWFLPQAAQWDSSHSMC